MWDFQINIRIFCIFVLCLHSFSWFPFLNTSRELEQQMEKRSTLYFEKERTRAALHRSKGYLNLSHPSYNMIRSLLTSKTLQLCKPKNLKKSYILSAVPCTMHLQLAETFLKFTIIEACTVHTRISKIFTLRASVRANLFTDFEEAFKKELHILRQ